MPNNSLISRRRRVLSRATTLLLGLPPAASNGWFLIGLSARLSPRLGFAVGAAWLGAGPLVLRRNLRATEREIRARQAASAEELPSATRRVRTAWRNVARAAEVPLSACTIRVIHDHDFRASVSHDRHIGVSLRAVEALTDRQLEAVIAHEFGHAIERDHRVQLLTRWYGGLFDRPIRAGTRFSLALSEKALTHSARDPASASAILLGAAGSLVGIGTMCALPAALWLLLGPRAALLALVGYPVRDVLSTRRSRWAETHADRVAVALGYGHHLRESLTIAEIDCATGPTITDLVPGWMNTHPSHDRRLAAIDDELRRRQER